MPTVPARDIPRLKEVLPEMTRRGSQPPPSASRGCPLRAAPRMEASRGCPQRSPAGSGTRWASREGKSRKKLESRGSPSPLPAQPRHRGPALAPGGLERLGAPSPELTKGTDGCLLIYFIFILTSFCFSLLFSGAARPLQAAGVPSFQGCCPLRGSARDAGSALLSLRAWAVSQGPRLSPDPCRCCRLGSNASVAFTLGTGLLCCSWARGICRALSPQKICIVEIFFLSLSFFFSQSKERCISHMFEWKL